MRGVNKVILLGTAGRDPEVRTFGDGGSIASVSIATSESWKDKNTGDRKEQTEWHKVTFSGRLAEIAADYIRKGSKVYVEGKLTTRKWQDKTTGVDKYSTEIKADNLQLLDSKPEGGQERSAPAQGNDTPPQQRSAPAANRRPPPPQNNDFDDDLPF